MDLIPTLIIFNGLLLSVYQTPDVSVLYWMVTNSRIRSVVINFKVNGRQWRVLAAVASADQILHFNRFLNSTRKETWGANKCSITSYFPPQKISSVCYFHENNVMQTKLIVLVMATVCFSGQVQLRGFTRVFFSPENSCCCWIKTIKLWARKLKQWAERSWMIIIHFFLNFCLF